MKKFVWLPLLCAVALAACVSAPPVTPPPNPTASFSLTLEPSSLKVGPATEVSAVVRVTKAGGFADPRGTEYSTGSGLIQLEPLLFCETSS